MAQRIMETKRNIATGCRKLAANCETMRRLHSDLGDPPLRRRNGGFPGRARIIVGQQLSIASADAIWRRFEATGASRSAAGFLRCDDETLRAAGLSRPKIRTVKAAADAVASRQLQLTKLESLSDEDVRAALTPSRASAPGRPTSTSCSASAVRTASSPAT